MSRPEPSERMDRGRAVEATSVALIGADSGPEGSLTAKVRDLLAERNVSFVELNARDVAHRSLPLPSVVATFSGDDHEITYRGYGRIVRDFVPLVGRR